MPIIFISFWVQRSQIKCYSFSNKTNIISLSLKKYEDTKFWSFRHFISCVRVKEINNVISLPCTDLCSCKGLETFKNVFTHALRKRFENLILFVKKAFGVICKLNVHFWFYENKLSILYCITWNFIKNLNVSHS